MTNNAYLVFAQKPDHVSRDEFYRWYADHAQENIESAGFVSAQRYSIREVIKGEAVGDEQHLAIYNYAGDMATWRNDLNRRIANRDIILRDWHDQIGFKSWTCTPEGGLLTPKTRS